MTIRTGKLYMSIVLSGVAFIVGGCLTPQVRYSRNAPVGRIDSYKVPRNWDYRKHYTIPAGRLTEIVESWMGTRYQYGGTSRRGLDCSGFVFLVFRELNGAKLPRSTRQLKKMGKPVSRSRACAGDLVFFRGGLFNRINHVGIYMGGNRIAHASSSKGVRYDSLDKEWFKQHFAGVRRVFKCQ